MKLMSIAIGKLKANPNNPRSFSRDQDLEDLGKSIEAHGIIEPLIVRKMTGGDYEVLAGHRRLMAAEGVLEELPCVVREEEAGDGLVIALVENTQRVDLSPFEQAQAIGKALGTIKQKELAAAIGRSATYVSKFSTIMKAARKLSAAGETEAVESMAEYSNMEELYEYAKSIIGGKQTKLELGTAEEDEEEADIEDEEGEGLCDADALKKMIEDQAKAAKVKLLHCSVVIGTGGEGAMAMDTVGPILTFKNMRDAERFFSSFQAKS